MRALIVLAMAAGLAACGTTPVRPAPPTIDCRQPAPSRLDALPAADEWVEWSPPDAQHPNGVARLSARAAEWVAGTLVARARDRGLWSAQEACLDGYEKAGSIRR